MTKLIEFMPVKKKMLLAAAVSCVLVFTLIALAFGETGNGPTYSGVSPASGINVGVLNPTISFVAADPDKINQSSIQVKLNGKILPVRVTYAQIGHYEDVYDTCSGEMISSWVIDGDDYTQATIAATTTSVPDQNTVTISVSDQLGNNSTNEWNFSAMTKPLIKNLSPVNGTTVGPKPGISAQVTDNGAIDPQSIIMKIDTERVVHSFDPATGIVTYNPVNPLPAGTHNFYLEVKDIAGNHAVATWSANVSADTSGPVLSGFYPAGGAEIKASSTEISFTALDADKIDIASAKVIVNGNTVPCTVTLDTTGHWEQYWDTCSGTYLETWVADTPDPTKATIKASVSNIPDANNVSVSIADQAGNNSSSEWTFNAMVPPVILELTPGNGKYTSDTLTKISAKVSDLGTIDPNSIVMKLNGTVVSHQYTAINGSSGIVSYTPVNPLSNGTQAVTLNVKDTAGNNNTAAWSFNMIAGNAVFSGEIPAINTTVHANNASINVNVTDVANLDQGTLRVTVNGKPVTASISFKTFGHYVQEYDTCTGEVLDVWVVDGYDYKTGTISAQANGLPDGKIPVSVTIGNVSGISSLHSWTFDVNVPPTISQPAPAANSTVQILTPVISANVSDNGSISAVKMTVNGIEMPASYDAVAGSVKYIPSTPLVNDTDYTIVVTAIDNVGAYTSLTWKFHTQVYSDMPIAGSCASCHLGFPSPNHPMSDCYGCHSGGPIGDCADCHAGEGEHSPGLISGYTCEYCHNATYSNKIPLHPADITIYHQTTTNMEDCKQCHQTSLSIEHSRYTDAAGNKYSCYTCHQSSKPEVQQALAQKLKSCDACHTITSHEEVHANSGLDDKCATCHINSLTKEHLTNTTTQTKALNCDTCHNNTNTDVSGAVDWSNKKCAACHQEGHNILFGEPIPSDLPLFDGFKWTIPGDIKLWAGEAWVPVEYLNGGKVIMSNRRSDVTAEQVGTYYQDNMTAQGWTLSSTAPLDGQNTFSVKFTKDSRKVTIWFYGGAIPGQSEPVNSGYRITIVYK